MCNLHQEVPKDDLAVYIQHHLRELWLPDYDAREPVPPFGEGLFLRPDGPGLRGVLGQWGLIRPGQPTRIEYLDPKSGKVLPPDSKIKGKARSTNNARSEGIEKKATYAQAWKSGKRCLIPCIWYQEPNWETKENIWWRLRRADGAPWMIAGLYDEDWFDRATGEMVPNYTMITVNCTGHPLLGRLHRPDVDPKTREVLPPDQQDKRSLVHIDPTNWDQWLHGSEGDARALLEPQLADVFDQADAIRTDEALAQLRGTASLF